MNDDNTSFLTISISWRTLYANNLTHVNNRQADGIIEAAQVVVVVLVGRRVQRRRRSKG